MSLLDHLIADKVKRQKAEFIMQVVRTAASVLAATALAIHLLR